MSEPAKTKVFLMVECEVEGDPNFFDLTDGTLKEVAKEVLWQAMMNDCSGSDHEGLKFKCLAGQVSIQTPKLITNDCELEMIEDGDGGVYLSNR